ERVGARPAGEGGRGDAGQRQAHAVAARQRGVGEGEVDVLGGGDGVAAAAAGERAAAGPAGDVERVGAGAAGEHGVLDVGQAEGRPAGAGQGLVAEGEVDVVAGHHRVGAALPVHAAGAGPAG